MSGKPAARQGDNTAGGPIVQGAASVKISGKPAARQGDETAAGPITQGSATVLVGGKPASRQDDATSGGPITNGAATVLIGAPNGVACSACPGGMAVGSPVNPLLGAKVLPSETDIVLPAPLPFVLSRGYSSYQTDKPAPVGLFGPGWQSPAEVRLQCREDALILNDNGGRSIHFEPLRPGEITFSRSERLWLARGGAARLLPDHALEETWHALPAELRLNRHLYFVTNEATGPWWVLGYTEPYVPDETDILPQPLPPYRTLQGLADRFGNILRYHREPDGPYKNAVTSVTDSSGRMFRLELVTLPGVATDKGGWGVDGGVRLQAVYLTHDPLYGPREAALARYDYNERGELAVVYDRSGRPVRHFRYHPRLTGRMVAHRFAGRPESSYQYDAQGRVTVQHNPEGLSYRFEYYRDRTLVTDSLSRREVYYFAGEGGLRRLVQHERADGTRVRHEYDDSGRLTADIDPLGRKTEYHLHPGDGRLLGITTHDGRKTRLDYNRRGQVTQTTAPNGTRTAQTYDALGRLTAVRDPEGRTVRYHYPDDSGNLPDVITDPAGGEVRTTRTRFGQPETVTDCSGKRTRWHYDRYGQPVQVEQEGGLRTRLHYDNCGRLSEQENAEGEITRWRYNEAGDLLTTLYPDGSEEQFHYGPRGELLSLSLGGLTRHAEYDAAGRLTRLVNENGAETLFGYDLLDHLTEERGFDGRTCCYDYDAAGRLIRSRDAGRVINWYYDDADRLSRLAREMTDDAQQEELWRHDIMGRLTEVSHVSQGHRVSVYYAYNKAGQVTEEQLRVINPKDELVWQHQVSHEYDALGLPCITQVEGLPPLRRQTYGSGHLLGVALGEQSLVEFTRDDLHRETERRFGAYVLNSRYTPAGRLQGAYLHDDPWHALSRRYGYDARGRLTALLAGGERYDYTYDAAGRLVQATAPRWQQQYRFDPAGNRLFRDGVLPSNQLSDDGEYRYRYDRFGSLVEKRRAGNDDEIHQYAWDAAQRLSRYRRTQGDRTLTAVYLYDPLGRRVGKQVLSRAANESGASQLQTFWYGWEGDRLTVTEHNGRRTHTIYHPGSFVPLLRVEGERPPVTPSLAEKLAQEAGVTFPPAVVSALNEVEQALRADAALPAESERWLAMTGFTREGLQAFVEPLASSEQRIHLYHCNHVGTPLALVTPEGKVEWQAEFDPWGNLLREENPQGLYQPLRMQGQHKDEESGLYYNRHRYYDPQQGRYISQDPIGLEGGWNLYQYPLNPMQYTDPLGLKIVVNGDSTDYDTAVKYLKKDSEMKKIIKKLEKSSKTYTINYFDEMNGYFDPNTDEISWNPKMAIDCTNNGGSLSPAMVLGHELAHAKRSWYHKLLSKINDGKDYGDYDNYEEKRVITGPEHHAAKTLGEGVRYDHRGSPRIVSSPTSR
ncbi:RHS repeat-associated core domain-containing protein [Mixta tenebrionis]|uniref:Type IV secretion protein Rhs n=1 Tax=Mixta tenebrionis TaxID=2562439 RepID=A0A506VAA4_9GAMM|nr:RHS repeat-associated core domain-containing protein [Mixta tenebrionis]TPW42914.1 type IV secretion protein Rhs [Mixta tenebrionis]